MDNSQNQKSTIEGSSPRTPRKKEIPQASGRTGIFRRQFTNLSMTSPISTQNNKRSKSNDSKCTTPKAPNSETSSIAPSPHSSNKCQLLSQIHIKKAQFLQHRQKLTEFQKEVLSIYHPYCQLQNKLNKINGKPDNFGVEKLNIFDFKDGANNTEVQTDVHETKTAPVITEAIVSDNATISEIKEFVFDICKTDFQLCQQIKEEYLQACQTKESGDCESASLQIPNFQHKIEAEEQMQRDKIERFMNQLGNNFNDMIERHKSELTRLENEFKEVEASNLEKKKQISKDSKRIKALENQLATIQSSIDQGNEVNSLQVVELNNHINALKTENESLKAEKFSESKKEFEAKENEIVRLKALVDHLDKELRTKTNDFVNQSQDIEKLNLAISHLKKHCNRDVDTAELVKSNEQLTQEVSRISEKYEFALHDLAEQRKAIALHEQMLKIRGDLIRNFTETEKSYKHQILNLHADRESKSIEITQLDQDVSSKAEELQSLFSTLCSKQMEISRQEHIIKLLEGRNEKKDQLRVRYEEKIGQLEAENCQLKRVLNDLGIYDSYGDDLGDLNSSVNRRIYKAERQHKREVERSLKNKKMAE